MQREEKIALKAAEIERDLADWAKRENILDRGEQIVFCLDVRWVGSYSSPVWEELLDTLRQMEVWEFFTPARLRACGASAKASTNIANKLRKQGLYEYSMEKFIKEYPDRES